ncbi:MAG TPA: YdcF family protein [Bryobacteraceae bacterium]
MSYIQPLLPVFILTIVLGLVRLWRHKKAMLLVSGVLCLFLLSWPPVDWLFSRPLVARYPVRSFPAAAPVEAIVVLSGAVDPPHYERPYPLASPDTYERCRFAAWLYRQNPHPVLVCGGPEAKGGQPYAVAMRDLLQQAGVPQAMIWTEELSRTTHENAVYGAAVLREHGIRTVALVVEAESMLRAEACFRKQGIVVMPTPCRFREFGPLSEELLPGWKAIQRNELILHESLGFAWYRLRGWI